VAAERVPVAVAAVEDRSGSPNEGVAVLREHLAVGAVRQLVGAGRQPVGGAGRVLADDVDEILLRSDGDRFGRSGGRALESRAFAAG
jgi:hypothetical protein